MAEAQITISTHDSLSAIGETAWDACASPETAGGGRPNDPFTTYRFLKALEDSRSVGVGTGWQPLYLTAQLDGEVIGCAPMYAKSHSQGEYIFDHNWAHAYERAGGRYYPKLQISVPFTPVTGRRLLVKPGFEDTAAAALVQGVVQVAEGGDLSSLHITFCTEQEAEAGARRWIDNNIEVYESTGALVEKYDVEQPGVLAGGGEYEVQDGFGWTNAVLLRLMDELGE